MNPFEQSRRNQPILSGTVPYGVFSQPVDDLVYSLDKFRPRFPLKWGELSLKVNDRVLPLTDDHVLSAVEYTFIRPFIADGLIPSRSGSGRLGGNLYWWSFGGILITLQAFKPFNQADKDYSLLVEFNPNKHDMELVLALINRIKSSMAGWFVWHNTRLDYALDIPYPISDVRLLTRKSPSCYEGTYYFGRRGKSGYTRVYDKRKQLIDTQRIDIGREVTRLEWESRAGDPISMDPPFIIKDLGNYEILRFVSMSDWPAALQTLDSRTAAKIRKSGLAAIDVDQAVFDGLRDQLFGYLGLDPADCHDHYEREKLREDESEDLEKIQSTLRKWAKIEH